MNEILEKLISDKKRESLLFSFLGDYEDKSVNKNLL